MGAVIPGFTPGAKVFESPTDAKSAELAAAGAPEGRYNTLMQELVKTGFAPASPLQFFEARVKIIGADYHDKLWRAYDTDFGLVVTEDMIYLFPNSNLLRNITAETPLNHTGSISLAPADLKEARSFKKKSLENILNRPLRHKDVVRHPLWLELAEGDKGMLGEYADVVFKLARDCNGHTEMMPFMVDYHIPGLNLRAVVIGGFGDDGQGRCYAGYQLLGSFCSRLVGIPLDNRL